MRKAVVKGSEVARLADRQVVVDVNLVEALEVYLEQAKRGEISSFMVFGFLQDKSTISYSSATDDVWRDVAALENLKHRILSGKLYGE